MLLRSMPEKFSVVGAAALTIARVSAKRAVSSSKVPWRGVMLVHRIGSTRIMANLIALVYDWWSLNPRFYDGGHHREAILHAKGDVIARAVTLISNAVQRIGRITERWSAEQRWTLLLRPLPGP